MVKKISEIEFQNVEKDELAVVDFSATWCGPCKMLAPVLEEVSEEFEGKAKFYNVDVDENPELASKFSIQTIPSLVILKKGEFISQTIGFQPKAKISKLVQEQA